MPIVFIEDLKAKALHMYGSITPKTCAKSFMSDGTSAVLLFRLSSYCYTYTVLVPIGMILARLNMILNGIVIGRGAKIGERLIIMHSVGVVINTHAIIGSGAIFQSGVVIGVRDKQSPIIGNKVYFGSGCKIIGGVRLGDNVKLGANAVVLSDIPSHCTAVGVPAKVIVKP